MNEESSMFKSKHIKEAVGRAIDSSGCAIPSYERNLYENLLIEMHELTKMEMSNLEKRMIERMDDRDKLEQDDYDAPEPEKVIDLSGIVGKQVRMIFHKSFVSGDASDTYGFLSAIKNESEFPFIIAGRPNYSTIEFDPDYWVPNISGENPWPAGVEYEVKFAEGCRAEEPATWNFSHDLYNSTIIASRFVRLKYGWRMPAAEDYK